MSTTAILPHEVYRLIGQRIREAREKRGLSQERLANEVALTRTSITNIEKGRQKVLVHTLFLLSEALGVSVVELITVPDKADPIRATETAVLGALSPDQREWVLAGVVEAVNKRK